MRWVSQADWLKGNIRGSAGPSAVWLTRQAGADQLFGSYPSRADRSGRSQRDDLRCSSIHGFVDVLSNARSGGDKRSIHLVNVTLSHTQSGLAKEGLDRWQGIAEVFGR